MKSFGLKSFIIKNLIRYLAGSLLLITSIVAYAGSTDSDDPDDNYATITNYPSFYSTAGIGFGKVYQKLSPPSYIKNKNFAWTAGAGFQFARPFALEGGYLDMPRVEGTLGYYPSVWYLTGNLIYQPQGSRFNIFGRIGFADSSRCKSLQLIVAAGATYFITPIISVNAQFIDVMASKQKSGSDRDRQLPNTTMIMMSLSYYVLF